MNNEDYYSSQFRAISGVLAAFFAGVLVCVIITAGFSMCGGRTGKITVERDTIYDILTIKEPVPVHDTILRYVKKNPIILHDTTIVLKNDTDIYITPDSQILVPISQKVYEDSTYRAYVSGYQAKLDSIFVFQKTIHERVTTVTGSQKKPNIDVGLFFGGGYGITTKRPDIFVGAGVVVTW